MSLPGVHYFAWVLSIFQPVLRNTRKIAHVRKKLQSSNQFLKFAQLILNDILICITSEQLEGTEYILTPNSLVASIKQVYGHILKLTYAFHDSNFSQLVQVTKQIQFMK